MNSTKFISASELSREIGCSVGRITAAVESGVLTPAGRAGASKNAAVVFLRDDIASIKNALEASGKFKAFAGAPRPSHHCRDASEVMEKAQALIRAREEAGNDI